MISEKFTYERTRRKACLAEKTMKNFDFDFYKEFSVYKFAMGLGLTKKEERMLCEHVKFNTYLEWKDYFVDKYKKLDEEKMEEFFAVIDVWKSRRKITKSTSGILLPALLTLAFEQWARCFQSAVELGIDNQKFVFSVITFVLAFIVVVLLGIFIINIMSLISKDGEEMEFCNTMKQILKKM